VLQSILALREGNIVFKSNKQCSLLSKGYPNLRRPLRKSAARLPASIDSSSGFVGPNISPSSILGIQLQKLKHALDQDFPILLCILLCKLAARPIVLSPLLAILLLLLPRRSLLTSQPLLTLHALSAHGLREQRLRLPGREALAFDFGEFLARGGEDVVGGRDVGGLLLVGGFEISEDGFRGRFGVFGGRCADVGGAFGQRLLSVGGGHGGCGVYRLKMWKVQGCFSMWRERGFLDSPRLCDSEWVSSKTRGSSLQSVGGSRCKYACVRASMGTTATLPLRKERRHVQSNAQTTSVHTYEPCKAIVRAYCSRFTTRGKESWIIFEYQLHMAGFPHRSVGMRQSHTGTFLEPRYFRRSQAPANGDPFDEGGALLLQVIQSPAFLYSKDSLLVIHSNLLSRHGSSNPSHLDCSSLLMLPEAKVKLILCLL
jgi:hypothetical protein